MDSRVNIPSTPKPGSTHTTSSLSSMLGKLSSQITTIGKDPKIAPRGGKTYRKNQPTAKENKEKHPNENTLKNKNTSILCV